MRPTIGPGSARYKLPPTVGYKNHDVRKDRLPRYSFGKRTVNELDLTGPGPAAVNLRGVKGQVNRYGKLHYLDYMGKNFNDTFYDCGPGPAKYVLPTSIGKHRTNMCVFRSQGYTCGKRTNEKYGDPTPGPNIYKLPKHFGEKRSNICKLKAPAHSLHKRFNDVRDDMGPGPAAYVPKYPHCNIKIKLKGPFTDITPDQGPGPNTYLNVRDYKPGIRKPAYTFGYPYSDFTAPMIIEGDNCC